VKIWQVLLSSLFIFNFYTSKKRKNPTVSLVLLLPNLSSLCYNTSDGKIPRESPAPTGAFSVDENAIQPNQTKGGVPMSFEAISNIAQAEAAAKASVANAQLRAKQLAADADSAGKLAVESALQKADQELKELSLKVNDKATGEAEKLSRDLEKQKAALRAKAQGKLETAAMRVVERIVNS
jgi:vacuolar-type H+-ATPase subunit H